MRCSRVPFRMTADLFAAFLVLREKLKSFVVSGVRVIAESGLVQCSAVTLCPQLMSSCGHSESLQTPQKRLQLLWGIS